MNVAFRRIVFFICLISLLPLSSRAAGSQSQPASQRPPEQQYQVKLSEEVGHRLRLLPFYSVFDNLAYSVDGDTVTLLGQVVLPTLKTDAQSAVKGIEGVAHIDNRIEVLPTSIGDDRLRRRLFRAVYGSDALQRYAIEAVQPIHIIVKNGHVTLVGVVARDMDKQIAGMSANSVPGVFSVQNELDVEQAKKK